MSDQNKQTLLKANAAVTAGDHGGFLKYCTEDVVWNFVGDRILKGKEAVQNYMQETYIQPPEFNIETITADGDFVTAVGSISLKEKEGKTNRYEYCDVWKFRDGLMAELKAFVIEIK
ncbi:ketosteroid isomerase-like protein [Flavobacterium sp. 270]|uniref:nuclear transport factor 2 family protein n=1 Tax=Flavobacterium sp. 270 TaxID=2512114 RepID=UPI00106698CB|nr:nuclear transport factor 2 family protein [Flavobacterium sp. 270]TDW51635.1 ketosteroid isomerase-like protein [Flavobacterium sp. 270]